MSAGSDARLDIALTVNGRAVTVHCRPWDRLLDTLRVELGLTGTKEGCGEGECGACTILLDGLPVNSCLIPTYQARGTDIRTVESVPPEQLHPLLESGATQCGACTPGVVVTASWVRDHPELCATHTLRQLMAGNLCRCTGYDGIIDGVQRTLDDAQRRGEAQA